MDRPTGQSLGGSSTPVSPSELRRRRLAALEGQQPPQQTSGEPTPTNLEGRAAAATQQHTVNKPMLIQRNPPSPPPPPHIVVPMSTVGGIVPIVDDDEEDDEDSELQAALAMSLEQQQQQQQHHHPVEPWQQQQQQQQQQTHHRIDDTDESQPQPQQQHHHHPYSQDVTDVVEWWKTGEAADVCSFHEIMWDSQITTENDKSCWVGQGIDVRCELMDQDMTSLSSSQQQPQPMDLQSTADDDDNNNKNYKEESMLTLLGSNHRPWGLQQAHGKPCGVLAAIQAEMLRILLFSSSSSSALDFPVWLDPSTAATTPNKSHLSVISPDIIRRALAMTISIILSRAAYMPCAATTATLGNVVTAAAGGGGADEMEHPNQQQQQQQSHSTLDQKRSVRLVLPLQPSEAGLGWSDLEPWDVAAIKSTSDGAPNNKSPSLRMYTIAPMDDDHISSPKRQKTNGSEAAVSLLEGNIIRLAHAVTTFLLHPSSGNVGGDGGDSGSSSGGECPLDSFRRPGGVILMVMSLVCSRGQTIVSQDMDYPTMLTSQFGHCGQELINLLLTGQAVSNVFDNSLTPSGELTCRGIQSRPALGYLSQLESMRYCEVGGYYKSPKFPIWVVGSTSHFTVLFGDASCLKESKSDILLEKCRRAFKAVEGGEENGFIPTTSLEKVLTLLDLHIGGDHAIQTLAAALEVSGAGIILWDDFWKATSRLMTGASLENVVRGAGGETGRKEGDPPTSVITGPPTDDEDRKQTIAERDAAMSNQSGSNWGSPSGVVGSGDNVQAAASLPAGRPSSPMEVDPAVSDEEFARRLQAQFDAQVSGATSTAASGGGSPASLSSQLKGLTPLFSDDDNNTNHAIADDVTTLTVFDDSKVTGSISAQSLDRVLEEEMTMTPPKHKSDFEKFGDSFLMYHYNGLRGGTLTPFRVTRLTPEEAVGASIALNRGNGHAAGHTAGGSGGDLEDIVRTKWPSCIVNWLGKTPPYID